MHKGDIVIAEHPDSRPHRLVRTYGIVQKITKTGEVLIETADGLTMMLPLQSVAVYIQPPANWQELYQQQETIFLQQRRRMAAGGTHLKHSQLKP